MSQFEVAIAGLRRSMRQWDEAPNPVEKAAANRLIRDQARSLLDEYDAVFRFDEQAITGRRDA